MANVEVGAWPEAEHLVRFSTDDEEFALLLSGKMLKSLRFP